MSNSKVHMRQCHNTDCRIILYVGSYEPMCFSSCPCCGSRGTLVSADALKALAAKNKGIWNE